MFKTNTMTYAGFQMTFANGWTVSVQWGLGTYSDNRYSDFRARAESKTAEIAAWDADGKWHTFVGDYEDTVKGWCKPDEVAEFIHFISTK